MAKTRQQQPPQDEEEYQEPQYEQQEFAPPEGEVREGEVREGEVPEGYDAAPQTNLGPGGPWLDHNVPPMPGTVEDGWVPEEPEEPPVEGETRQEEYQEEPVQ